VHLETSTSIDEEDEPGQDLKTKPNAPRGKRESPPLAWIGCRLIQ
jgi:hypothetical protein